MPGGANAGESGARDDTARQGQAGHASSAAIYHRKESPTQSRADAQQQELTSEIWGKDRRGGAFPCVKAYRGSLPANERGVEFTTDIPPTHGDPHTALWYYGFHAAIKLHTRNGDTFAAIRVTILKNTQVP